MDAYLTKILNLIRESRNLDFSGYDASMIDSRIKNRSHLVACRDTEAYFHYLRAHPDEMDRLLNAFMIHVSRFFRNPLTFEYLSEIILPRIVLDKREDTDGFLRIWSAGCAMGEEPYSMAILINECLKKEKMGLDCHIFATDIDRKLLQKAEKAIYPAESVENVKYRLLKDYFAFQKDRFSLIPEIRRMVSFSPYNILDTKSFAPPDSIFGGFDLVLCRNVLIYFNIENQDLIFEKLHRSLNPGGYLVLGRAEMPVGKYNKYFRAEAEHTRTYRKVG